LPTPWDPPSTVEVAAIAAAHMIGSLFWLMKSHQLGGEVLLEALCVHGRLDRRELVLSPSHTHTHTHTHHIRVQLRLTNLKISG
jgi:hypothetical protein